MRIRRSTTSSISPSPTVSPSSCSSSSSCFSSSTTTTTHSTISTHSLTSSSNSTSSSSSPSLSLSLSSKSNRRCQGLDLLVKAVYYVAGSVVGVPYIQRRVIRRRKPALRFANLVINNNSEHVDLDVDEQVIDCSSSKPIPMPKPKNKQKRRSKGAGAGAIPLKYHDSLLQSWKPSDRSRRKTIKG